MTLRANEIKDTFAENSGTEICAFSPLDINPGACRLGLWPRLYHEKSKKTRATTLRQNEPCGYGLSVCQAAVETPLSFFQFFEPVNSVLSGLGWSFFHL